MNDAIVAERRRKIQQEIEASKRIRELGLHPIDVLDDMFHTMMELRKATLKRVHPDATDDEILHMMQEEVRSADRYKRHSW